MNKHTISPKRIFYVIFWTTLFISVWLQILDPNDPFEWLLPTLFFLLISISISHYVSDYELPKALRKGEIKQFIVKALLFTLFLSLTLALYFTFFPSYMNKYELLIQQEQISEQTRFITQLYKSFPSAMAIITTTCGIRFYEEHNKIEQINAKLKQEHLEAHLKLLQDQINPHLMFNILNHIYTLMQIDVELASNVLLKFSDILRYQLYECNHKTVLLDREVQYLQDLIAIEQVRWGDELEVNSTWSIHNKELHITPLLLVPLIENAFKHVSRLPNKKGYIIIKCTELNNTLHLYIENSFSTKYKIEKKAGGIGIANVRERLLMQYSDAHSFHITHSDEKHIVELTINLKNQ
ncbi:sensor histidine kinase [Myroides profundi]|uniref:GHKL domain-containing protein n=1 Tax=Myroides profundi TaxID=480520 RepID=A0AAJ5BE37_MYRPR|nr:histidine kinase [Myroides profundi]AJH14569.1 histidine kinase [Myroides profundi]SEQ92163.1 GHKL domain-containing protein [Myroides profundi]